VCAHALKAEEYFYKIVDVDSFSRVSMTYLKILAVDTPEIAGREENVS
jgi:hypothetical protein